MTQAPEPLLDGLKQLQASAIEFLETVAPLFSPSEVPAGATTSGADE
ncbi:hypothetical protein [Nocardioides yefusunii]|uniref:Uncharacterized protein n=1 Tax=Nocardioides yefusunii TaxID=2500546 RepID=A0ABW1QV14_9ACTN|nr:hypothetical protein [Nocardioides yefusunii]